MQPVSYSVVDLDTGAILAGPGLDEVRAEQHAIIARRNGYDADVVSDASIAASRTWAAEDAAKRARRG